MAFWMLCPLPASAQVLDFRIDHFWCYLTTNQPVNEPVLLQDQFDRQIGAAFRENVLVWRPVRFCNPVKKLVQSTGQLTDIRNPESHLKLYRMLVDDPDLAPTRKVKIQNQFGTKTIQTLQQTVLAVPSTKQIPGGPPPGEFHDLDHFKCYAAYGAKVNKVVTLSDQFQTRQNLKVTYPYIFCNPTEKVHHDVVTPITNPEDHIVCYLVTKVTFNATVIARNQFGLETLVLRTPDLLCVPSKKLKVTILS
jgi:hypothetical protein